jgi:hypothetical protein
MGTFCRCTCQLRYKNVRSLIDKTCGFCAKRVLDTPVLRATVLIKCFLDIDGVEQLDFLSRSFFLGHRK